MTSWGNPSFDRQPDSPADPQPEAQDAAADVRKNEQGETIRDFGNYDDAVAQAKALGVDAGEIVAIGTAYHIPGDE